MQNLTTTLSPLSSLRFSTPEELQKLFDTYEKIANNKNQTLTLAGLLIVLGLSRKQYDTLCSHPLFADKCRKFNFQIENAWVQRLMGTGAQGAMFYLKNVFKDDYKDHYDATVTHLSPSPILGPIVGQDEATKIIDVTPQSS